MHVFFLIYRDGAGNQLPFANYVMITVNRNYRETLIIEEFDGRLARIGTDPRYDWVDIPGTDNEGLLFTLPEGQGKCGVTASVV